MNTLLSSAGIVAVSEIGDKTQLLALVLALRFRAPVAIILGILVATLANHALAGCAGYWLAGALDPRWLRWVLGLLFLAMAGWALIPDKMAETESRRAPAGGAFSASALAFFLAEMGDKTQIATAALAAQSGSLLTVVAGTTLGMMIADVPVVLIGGRGAKLINLAYVRWAAAVIFAGLGVLAMAGQSALGRAVGAF